jgi:hypothetical protein
MEKGLEASLEKKSFLKKLLKETLCNSVAQAILNLIETPHKLLKLFLFTIVTCSTGMAGYMVINSIINYYAYRVVTTSRTYHEIPALFPKVTFCNLNKYTTEYGFKTDDVNLTISQRKLLGHDLDDILIHCEFNFVECNSSDFVWSFDEAYGNCYSFNSGFDSKGNKVDLKQSAFVGSDYGLYMELYVNFYEKLTKSNSRQHGMGIVIRIENSSYWLDHGRDGVFVSAGFETNIVVRRDFKFNLPKPYSACEITAYGDDTSFKSNLYESITKSKYKYSRQFSIFYYD